MLQTERLKEAEKMTKTKVQVQILKEPCDEILEKKKDVTSLRSLLQLTYSHQNDPGRSTAVPINEKSSTANMDSGT